MKQRVCEMSLLYCLLIAPALIASVVSGSGSCPPTLPVDVCEPTCGPTIACEGKQLCCPTACGGAMCVDPMTQRQHVHLVKQGTCPEEPRGAWICSDSCTGDSDCPRALKCCPNRCGALTCQKPEQDHATPAPSFQ